MNQEKKPLHQESSGTLLYYEQLKKYQRQQQQRTPTQQELEAGKEIQAILRNRYFHS